MVPSDQLRKDAIYQQQSNVAERNLRAKAVGQTITGNKAQADSIAAREQVPAAEGPPERSRGGMQSPAPARAAPAANARLPHRSSDQPMARKSSSSERPEPFAFTAITGRTQERRIVSAVLPSNDA